MLTPTLFGMKMGTTSGSVFVTVGTTRFDELVKAATSEVAIKWMISEGYTSLTVQYGAGEPPNTESLAQYPISIQTYDFLPSLDLDMRRASLILSHAGAGTVMEALKLEKKLVVVINTRLMNNHQTELAGAMAERGHLFMVENPEELENATIWQRFSTFQPIRHQAGDASDFSRLLDRHLGFVGLKTD